VRFSAHRTLTKSAPEKKYNFRPARRPHRPRVLTAAVTTRGPAVFFWPVQRKGRPDPAMSNFLVTSSFIPRPLAGHRYPFRRSSAFVHAVLVPAILVEPRPARVGSCLRRLKDVQVPKHRSSAFRGGPILAAELYYPAAAGVAPASRFAACRNPGMFGGKCAHPSLYTSALGQEIDSRQVIRRSSLRCAEPTLGLRAANQFHAPRRRQESYTDECATCWPHDKLAAPSEPESRVPANLFTPASFSLGLRPSRASTRSFTHSRPISGHRRIDPVRPLRYDSPPPLPPPPPPSARPPPPSTERTRPHLPLPIPPRFARSPSLVRTTL